MPDEHLLTGNTASKVRAVALARYPGATVLRVATDYDAVYETHLRTADGQHPNVEVGKGLQGDRSEGRIHPTGHRRTAALLGCTTGRPTARGRVFLARPLAMPG